jgi:hypothetical protein
MPRERSGSPFSYATWNNNQKGKSKILENGITEVAGPKFRSYFIKTFSMFFLLFDSTNSCIYGRVE